MTKNTVVLIIEGELTSRILMERSVSTLGFEVQTADSAESGLEVLKSQHIDLLILDWMLPGMNGIELCKLLRSDTSYSSLYIIFMTAMTDHESLITALESGADDFANKPFKVDEMKARLNVASRLKTVEYALKEQSTLNKKFAEEMEELAEERAKQLVHSDRMASIGTLSEGVAHEINNPMTFIAGNVNVLENFLPYINTLYDLAPEDHPDKDQFDFIKDELPKLIEAMNSGVQRTTKIINSLKAFSHHSQNEEQKFTHVTIAGILEDARVLCSTSISKNVTIDTSETDNLPDVLGDHQQLEQVFVNLLINASDAMAEEVGSQINISGRILGNYVVLTIADNGPGIPQDLLEKIWDPFFTTKPVGKGTGLGLSISFGIIEAHAGKIKVRNTSGGAEFTITLPIYKK